MSLAVEPPSAPGLWPSVGKLLKLRLAIFFNGFRRSRLRYKIWMMALALFALAFLGVVFFLTWQFLRFMRLPEFQDFTAQFSTLFERIPVFIFSGTFVGIFITSFGVLLQALYLAGDMDFLLTTPVPLRAVFVAKLLQAILPNFALICLLALPVLYGLGASYGYSWLYYPAALLVMAALALAAAGLSGLLVMLVVRVFPARRIAEVLGFLGAVFSFLCSQTGQLARFNDWEDGQGATAIANLTAWFDRADLAWSPLTWAGNGVSALGRGELAQGLGLTTVALVLAGAVFAVSLATAEQLYYSGWAGLQSNSRKKRPPRAATRSAGAAGIQARLAHLATRPVPQAVRGVIAKDWLVLRRDLRNLSQLVTPLILGIVYAFAILGNRNDRVFGEGTPPVLAALLSNISTYATVGLSLFVGWMLLGRLAGMGFAQEGKSFWVLKTAPVSAGQLILAKYLVAYLPTLGMSIAYLVVIWLIDRSTLLVLVYSMVVVALSIAGNAGINLAFGIVGTNLAWEDPRHMQRTATGCLGAIATMAYLPASLAFFFGPAILAQLVGWPEAAGQGIGLALGGAATLACAGVPLLLVRKNVEQMGEG